MTTQIKELQEKRGQLAAEIRKLADVVNGDDKRPWTAEEEKRWEAVNKDYDANLKQIEISERASKVEADARIVPTSNIGRDDFSGQDSLPTEDRSGPVDHDGDLRRGLAAWANLRIDPSRVSEDDMKAAKRAGIDPRARETVIKLAPDIDTFERRQRLFRTRKPDVAYEESRALSTKLGQSVGFSIAPIFNSSVESALLYYGPMLQLATPIRTATAADYPMMTENETSKSGSYTDENTALTTDEDVTIRTTVFGAYKATTNAILVPMEAFRDSAIDLNSFLAAKLGERLGRFINTETTTGAVKCKGIVTDAAAGVTTASSTSIQMDEVLELLHSVDRAYREQPGFGFMFHDDILLALRKLKNGEGDYLWQAGTQAGEPDRLWNKPYYINNDMASTMATTNVTMLAGLFPKYHIRTVGDIRMTMTDQRYWEYDQVGFAAYTFFDGALLDAGTGPVKKLTQA